MAESVKKGKTGKFVKKGHTAGPFGNDPSITTSTSKRPARELTP